ncbi:MAG: GUN4 domain-containing protein [Brasilonema octagenarum HA4186-MV1]|jgi:hypothetical protein|nr:GUN4 domain-containing protein [Brasilonema octagenarum HA4186-MV1]
MSQYKVFLCHNTKDKPGVRQIRDMLRQQGIETWMDEKDIIGFDDWNKKIEENLSQMNAVAVFLGSSGFGEWQKSEIIYTKQEINRHEQNKLPPLRAGLVILDNCQQTFQEIRDNYYHTPNGWLFNHHTVDLRTSKAPMQELIGAITGQPWEVDDLSSKRAVDYTVLRDLLKAGKWKIADQETLAVMLEAAGREQQARLDILDIKSIQNFPCTDLRTIDQLWVKYSSGHFGFSVQKRIWESEGKDIRNYGDRVGWRKRPFLNWLDYNKLTFSTKAPQGHLPAVFSALAPHYSEKLGFLGLSFFFSSVTSSLLSRPDL